MKVRDILDGKLTFSTRNRREESRRNGRSKELNNFDKGQIVMARQLCVSKMARLAGRSRSVGVKTY